METSPTKNPFEGYMDRLLKNDKKVNPVHEIVNMYYQMKGVDKKSKEFFVGRMGYPKLAREAKLLYQACGQNLDDALWSLDKMKYLAEKGNFDWSISTCLKHNLKW